MAHQASLGCKDVTLERHATIAEYDLVVSCAPQWIDMANSLSISTLDNHSNDRFSASSIYAANSTLCISEK